MKRIIAILLALVLVVCMSGCKAQNDSNLNMVQGSSGVVSGGNQADQGATPDAGDTATPGDTTTPDAGDTTPGDTTTPDAGDAATPDAGTANGGNTNSGNTNGDVDHSNNPAYTVDYTAEGWIKVCSYNIKSLYYDPATDGNGPPLSRIDDVVAELKKIDADIVGLQELDRWNENSGPKVDELETLARLLGYQYYAFCKATGKGAGEYGHGILSRYPIKKSEIYRFKDYNIDAAEPRAFSRNELKVGNETLVFYNTHLAGHQKEQMKMITKMMKNDLSKGKYAVLTGDMNAWPNQLHNMMDKSACMMLNTLEDPQGTTLKKYEKGIENPIDNIVVTTNCEYYWDSELKSGIKFNVTDASDHFPIYTYIKFKK